MRIANELTNKIMYIKKKKHRYTNIINKKKKKQTNNSYKICGDTLSARID